MKRDISETIGIGIILAISGGLMDAYSYICRGQVFANAQTGNILLLSISLSTGDISGFLHHFYPVVAFASGIALAILLRHLLISENIGNCLCYLSKQHYYSRWPSFRMI